MIEHKRFVFSNAETVKIKNSRITVASLQEKDYGIVFKILSDDTSPRAMHSVKKDKVVITGIRISKNAAFALLVALQERLKADGII